MPTNVDEFIKKLKSNESCDINFRDITVDDNGNERLLRFAANVPNNKIDQDACKKLCSAVLEYLNKTGKGSDASRININFADINFSNCHQGIIDLLTELLTADQKKNVYIMLGNPHRNQLLDGELKKLTSIVDKVVHKGMDWVRKSVDKLWPCGDHVGKECIDRLTAKDPDKINSLATPLVEELTVKGSIDESSAQNIVKDLQDTACTTLKFARGCRLGNEATKIIFDYLGKSDRTIKRLDLREIILNNVQLSQLQAALKKNTTVTFIDVDDQVEQIFKNIETTSDDKGYGINIKGLLNNNADAEPIDLSRHRTKATKPGAGQKLHLSCKKEVDNNTIKNICKMLESNKTLKYLHLEFELNNEQCSQLADSLQKNSTITIVEMKVENNSGTQEACKKITEVIKLNRKLEAESYKKVRVRAGENRESEVMEKNNHYNEGNYIGTLSAAAVVEHIKKHPCKKLFFSSDDCPCYLSESAISTICSYLETDKTIQKVNLKSVEFNTANLQCLHKMLEKNTTVTSINISFDKIYAKLNERHKFSQKKDKTLLTEIFDRLNRNVVLKQIANKEKSLGFDCQDANFYLTIGTETLRVLSDHIAQSKVPCVVKMGIIFNQELIRELVDKVKGKKVILDMTNSPLGDISVDNGRKMFDVNIEFLRGLLSDKKKQYPNLLIRLPNDHSFSHGRDSLLNDLCSTSIHDLHTICDRGSQLKIFTSNGKNGIIEVRDKAYLGVNTVEELIQGIEKNISAQKVTVKFHFVQISDVEKLNKYLSRVTVNKDITLDFSDCYSHLEKGDVPVVKNERLHIAAPEHPKVVMLQQSTNNKVIFFNSTYSAEDVLGLINDTAPRQVRLDKMPFSIGAAIALLQAYQDGKVPSGVSIVLPLSEHPKDIQNIIDQIKILQKKQDKDVCDKEGFVFIEPEELTDVKGENDARVEVVYDFFNRF
jgi:hypothetical protein